MYDKSVFGDAMKLNRENLIKFHAERKSGTKTLTHTKHLHISRQVKSKKKKNTSKQADCGR